MIYKFKDRGYGYNDPFDWISEKIHISRWDWIGNDPGYDRYEFKNKQDVFWYWIVWE